MDEQKQNQLFIFKKVQADSIFGYDSFVLLKKVILKDISLFKKVSMEFFFKKDDQEPNSRIDTIIFAKTDQIFEFNFVTEEITTIIRFK
jgi:hypothetical protein